MKQVILSLVLASALFALAGALFFARSVASGPDSASVRKYDQIAAHVEGEVAALKGRLEELERMLSSTASEERSRAGGYGTLGANLQAGAVPADAGTSSAEGGAEPGKKEGGKALASLAAHESDDLRNFVQQVIQEEREERRREDQRKLAERQEELAALQKGPYGQFNYRMNTMGKRLDLNEVQKQRYHEFLADYSTRIEEIRKNLDRQDPVAYKSYQERKKQLISEFDGLVIQSLTPFQSQEYQEMTSHEKSPALENATSGGGAIAYTSISADGDLTVERRARVILNGDPVPPPGFEKMPLLEKLFEVPAPEGGATPAAK